MIDVKLKGKTVKSVIKKSENILSVFKSTVDNLLNLNQEALEEKSRREDQASILIDEAQEIGEMVKNNEKIVKKIQDFLN
jgi:hypothetical protein